MNECLQQRHTIAEKSIKFDFHIFRSPFFWLCEVDKELLRCPSQPVECIPNHDFELQSISFPLLEGVIEEVQKIS